MDLPELGLQWVCARIAWGVVCAALVLALLPARLAPHAAGGAAGLVALSMWLPGAASPAFWLGLVFQYPSVTLAICLAAAPWRWAAARRAAAAQPLATPTLTPATFTPRLDPLFAAALAGGGALLYLDAAGGLQLDLYARGSDPDVAPVAALLLGAAAAGLIVRAGSSVPAWALLVAVTLFSVARLPTGNLFDAVLDPLLWLWAVAVSLRVVARGLWRR
jgi:hypothetical protein